MGGGDHDEDYDSNRRISLTQAYRRNNNVRPPMSTMSGQRRIAINNGNHPIYKVRYRKPERILNSFVVRVLVSFIFDHSQIISIRYRN